MNTTLALCGCACLLAAPAAAETFTLPHVLDVSGTLHAGPTSPFSLGGFTHTLDVDSFGPGENGEFNYLYSSPIVISGADVLGRSFSLSLEVLFAQTRPEGSGYRSEFFVAPTWTHLNGEALTGGSGGLWELSVFGFDPQPIASSQLIFDTPATHFAAEDGSGRTNSIDMSAGELRIGNIPSPWTGALLALAGLLRLRPRRD